MAAAKTLDSPLARMLEAGSITRIEVAAAAGVSLSIVARLCLLEPAAVSRMPLHSIQRVALALGCAPAELVPWLASSPRNGLLWERGVRGRPDRRRPVPQGGRSTPPLHSTT